MYFIDLFIYTTRETFRRLFYLFIYLFVVNQLCPATLRSRFLFICCKSIKIVVKQQMKQYNRPYNYANAHRLSTHDANACGKIIGIVILFHL